LEIANERSLFVFVFFICKTGKLECTLDAKSRHSRTKEAQKIISFNYRQAKHFFQMKQKIFKKILAPSDEEGAKNFLFVVFLLNMKI
jgi:hypothetical protein